MLPAVAIWLNRRAVLGKVRISPMRALRGDTAFRCKAQFAANGEPFAKTAIW